MSRNIIWGNFEPTLIFEGKALQMNLRLTYEHAIRQTH
jgi:hypothetical protein